MKKRKISKSSVASNPDNSRKLQNPSFIIANGLFTFPNGDKYEGAYKVDGEKMLLLRQGHGIYDTADFNKYECTWDSDKIDHGLHIRFNNGSEYKGFVDENEKMCGQGTYIFTDRSSLSGEWKDNKIVGDIRYEEPLGFVWHGRISDDGKRITFGTRNHFWDDILKNEKSESPGNEARDS